MEKSSLFMHNIQFSLSKFITSLLQKFSDSLLELNDFNKLKLISAGTNSEIFLVEPNTTKKHYISKVYKNAFNTHQNKVSFIKEVEFRMKQNCPELMPIIGCSLTDFDGMLNPTILTDAIENGSLEMMFNLHFDFSQPKKYILLLSIVHCLDFMHSKNVMNLNLKPSNILLDYDLYPRICDFYGFKTHILKDNID